MKLAHLLLAPALVIGISACADGDDPSGSGAAGSAGRAALDLEQVVDEVIVPRYDTFAGASGTLTAAVADLCAGPSASALETARRRWIDTRTAWRRTIAFGVGPAMALRTKSAVDFPASPEKVAAFVAGPEPITHASVANLGSSARGLGAIEALLYGPQANPLTGPAGGRQCQYAAATAQLVEEAASEVAAAWSADAGGARTTFTSDELMATNDVFNQIVGTLQAVADQRLATAVGETEGTPNPAAAEPGPAQRALDDMVADLDGVVAAYDAMLHDAVGRQSTEAADRARQQLVDGAEALSVLPRPLTEAVTAEPDAARAALEALRSAKRTLATEVASLLGLTLTFSDADGDS